MASSVWDDLLASPSPSAPLPPPPSPPASAPSAGTQGAPSVWDDLLASPAPAPAAGPRPRPFVPKTKRYYDPAWARGAEAKLEWAMNSPFVRGADAIINAEPHAAEGAIVGGPKEAWRAMTHPAGAAAETSAAEQKLNLAQSSNPFMRAVGDFGFETILSAPQFAIPGLGELSLLSRAAKAAGKAGGAASRAASGPVGAVVNAAGKGVDAAAKAAHPLGQAVRAAFKKPPTAFERPSPTIRASFNKAAGAAGAFKEKTLDWVVEGRDLARAFTRKGLDIIYGHQGAGRVARKAEENAYAALIEKYRPELERADELRRNLEDRLAYVMHDLRDHVAAGRTAPPPVLNSMDMQGLSADEKFARLNAWAKGPRNSQADALRAEMAHLESALKASEDAIPQEIRHALLRRAFLEGTNEVRAKAMAAGFRPTEEEAQAPVLNVLHRFDSNYEPTQRLYSAKDVERTQGPVFYTVQGNRKASFDLPKLGGVPGTPLADRLLDRLTRGARITEYHDTRRKILRDLGLGPSRIEGIQRADARVREAMASNDPAEVRRALAFANGQRKLYDDAAKLRAQTIRPGAPTTEVTLEYLDPVTAREDALDRMRAAGHDTGDVTAHTTGESLAEDLGKYKGYKHAAGVSANAAKAASLAARQTARGVSAVVGKHQSRLAGKLAFIRSAAAKQSGRIGKLGAALENHDLVRAGLASHLPGLQESAKELQAAYVAAQHLAGTAYASGYGKDVDEWAHEFASHRIDHPAGTNLLVIGEGEGTRVLGGRTTGTSGYAKAEIKKIASLIRKSGKKGTGATDADALRVLDEAHNAIGQARETVDDIARKYDIDRAGHSPEGIADSMREMRDQFVQTHADVRADIAKHPAVPGAIRRAIKAATKGDASLQAAIGKAAKPEDVSLQRALSPSQRAAQQAQEAAGHVTVKAQTAKQRLDAHRQANATVKAMTIDAKAAEAARNSVEMPQALSRKLFEDIPNYNRSVFTAFSDLQRDALFVLPFAHQKNITILAALGPNGAKVVSRGVQIAIEMRLNPISHRVAQDKLAAMGAMENFAAEGERGYEHLPIVGKPLGRLVDKISTAPLDRYDTAMRIALLEELEKHGTTGFEAGGIIRDVLGNYHDKSGFVSFLRHAGGGFPQWGLGVGPRSMTKALREQPNSVKALARGERIISDDITQPAFGGDLDTGGPEADYFKLWMAPQSFFTSPSRVGPVADVFRAYQAWRSGQVGPLLGQESLRFVPGSSVGEAASGFPYQSKAPGPLRAAAGAAGMFFPQKPSLTAREYQLHALGMPWGKTPPGLRGMGKFKVKKQLLPGPEMRRELEWEGYFRRVAPKVAP